MTDIYLHEALYRGRPAIEKLGQASITLCGAGALGSLLADNLARQGLRRLTIIDFDRVEQHNAGTQLYAEADVGAKKVDLLRSHLYRSVGAKIPGCDSWPLFAVKSVRSRPLASSCQKATNKTNPKVTTANSRIIHLEFRIITRLIFLLLCGAKYTRITSSVPIIYSFVLDGYTRRYHGALVVGAT